jgi:NAD-dependent histone deacetylase SIR2
MNQETYSFCADSQDFRSEDGLYALVKKRYPQSVVQGKDLFDAGLFRSPDTAALFYTFMGELSVLCSAAKTTPTHSFVSYLHHKRRALLRWYTQNIDGLEELSLAGVSLETEMELPPPIQESGEESKPVATSTGKAKFPLVVQLHGNLQSVKCTLCPHQS